MVRACQEKSGRVYGKEDTANAKIGSEKERETKEKMAAGGERGHGESWGSGGGCGR